MLFRAPWLLSSFFFSRENKTHIYRLRPSGLGACIPFYFGKKRVIVNIHALLRKESCNVMLAWRLNLVSCQFELHVSSICQICMGSFGKNCLLVAAP
jgi:hypothetical protein